MTLDELAIKYGTDKSSLHHNYTEFYEKYLPKNPKKILEIGVLTGASIRMWKEYFPEAEIHGLDLFEEHSEPDIEGVKWWKGSQTDPNILHLLRKENFDLIIDDGSHVSIHQLVTFFSLYQRDCYYFVEDIHCNNEEFYRDGLPHSLTIENILYNFSGYRFDCLTQKIMLLHIPTIPKVL
jgi:hypothetical protein